MDTTNIRAAVTARRFTKQQLFEELASFMPAFVRSVQRLFGTGVTALLRAPESSPDAVDLTALQASPLWRAVSELYDYGVFGVLPEVDDLGDGSLLDVQLFLEGIDGLAEYLREDEGFVPRLCKRTLKMAQVRQELDGSTPHGVIELWKVALLAPTAQDGLRAYAELVREAVTIDGLHWEGSTTEIEGLPVPVEHARRWLAACAGFVVTGSQPRPEFRFVGSFTAQIPMDVLRAIQERAGRTSTTPFQVLRDAFAQEIALDPLFRPVAVSDDKDASGAPSLVAA